MARSRLIALLDARDQSLGSGGEDYTTGATNRTLWQGGWRAFYDEMGVAALWGTLGVSRFCLYAPWGVYAVADAVTIGYDAAQAAVTTTLLTPRQSETDLADDRLVNGLGSMPGFVAFWGGIVADFASQGGEVMCYQGAPAYTLSTVALTLDNQVREAETCNMSVGLDGAAYADRLSYDTPASRLSDRLALRNRRTYVSQHAALDSRVNDWADGRFGVLSGKTRADLVAATPASYNLPANGQESVVLLDAFAESDPADRVQLALQWIGREHYGSPWTAAVYLADMTSAQVTTILNAAG